MLVGILMEKFGGAITNGFAKFGFMGLGAERFVAIHLKI